MYVAQTADFARWVPLTAAQGTLKERLEELIPKKIEQIAQFRKEHAKTKICSVEVDQIYGGMRGIVALVTETSLLDPNEVGFIKRSPLNGRLILDTGHSLPGIQHS